MFALPSPHHITTPHHTAPQLMSDPPIPHPHPQTRENETDLQAVPDAQELHSHPIPSFKLEKHSVVSTVSDRCVPKWSNSHPITSYHAITALLHTI